MIFICFLFQCYAAKNRIKTLHLDDKQPSGSDIRNIPFMKYIPSNAEQASLKTDIEEMIERICVEHLGYFNDLAEYISWGIEHHHTKELSQKSTIVSYQIP